MHGQNHIKFGLHNFWRIL